MKHHLFPLGRIAGLELRARPSALAAAALLWATLATVSAAFLDFGPLAAAAAGAAGMLLHFLGELWHQFGHAFAARRTGYPMQAVEFWWFFGASIYPEDEPALPAAVHIRRALGGVPFSLLLAGAGGIAWLLLPPEAGPVRWLAAFVGLENLLVFGLGSLLPLGFTDGSTLLRCWKEK